MVKQANEEGLAVVEVRDYQGVDQKLCSVIGQEGVFFKDVAEVEAASFGQ